MRLSLFLNNDLESNIALNGLLPEIQKHQFNIYLSEKVGPSSHSIQALQYLDFLEREFIHTSLFPKLEDQPAAGFLTFNQIARKHKADLSHISEIKTQSTLDKIAAFNPDLFISIRFGKIFKGKMLQIPPMGIINLHSALLPDYKGVLGTVRAFMDGKPTIGSTIHYIKNSEIDTGDILSINSCAVASNKSVLWHIVHLYPTAIANLCSIIDQLSLGNEIRTYAQSAGGHYFSFPNEDDFKILKQKGVNLFSLEDYAEVISVFYAVEKIWILNELASKGIPESF